MRVLWLTALFTALGLLSGDLAAQQPGFQMEAGAISSVERLTGGLADWRSTQLDLLARNAARQSYYGHLLETGRFGQTDNELMVGSYQPLGASWAAQVEAAVSPTHKVLAKDSLLVQLERRFDDGWGIQGGYRRSEYELASADLVIASIDRYFSHFRAAYTLYLGRPEGGSFGSSHRLDWSYYYGDHSFVGISAAAGREVDNIFPSGILSTRVRSLSLAGQHEFSPGWFASYAWLTQHQGDLYTRRGLSLGLRHIF